MHVTAWLTPKIQLHLVNTAQNHPPKFEFVWQKQPSTFKFGWLLDLTVTHILVLATTTFLTFDVCSNMRLQASHFHKPNACYGLVDTCIVYYVPLPTCIYIFIHKLMVFTQVSDVNITPCQNLIRHKMLHSIWTTLQSNFKNSHVAFLSLHPMEIILQTFLYLLEAHGLILTSTWWQGSWHLCQVNTNNNEVSQRNQNEISVLEWCWMLYWHPWKLCLTEKSQSWVQLTSYQSYTSS